MMNNDSGRFPAVRCFHCVFCRSRSQRQSPPQLRATGTGESQAIKITIEVDEDRLREAGDGTTDAEHRPRSRPWQTGRG